jgi:glutaredoxin-related protein
MNLSKSNATSSQVSVCVQYATSLAKNYDGVVIMSGKAKMCILMILRDSAEVLLAPQKLTDK